MIGFSLSSGKPFSAIKKAIFQRLQTLNAFLRPHLQNIWTKMDTVPVGHVHKRNSKFADLDEILVDIETTLTSVIHRNQDNTDFQKMQPSDDIWSLPEILVYPGHPPVHHNGLSVHSDAIEISTNRADSQCLKFLIQHSANLEDPDIQLVLRNLRFEMPAVYANLLGDQNKYLESHRNIAIAGLCKEAMDVENVVDITGNHFPTMREAIQAVSGIEQVYATKRITDLGKWNISTTVDQWENAKTWINQNLLPMYRSINDNVKLGYPKFQDFPVPARMFFKGWSDTATSISGTANRSAAESYAKTLQASILGHTHDPVTPTPRPPAWQQISKPTVIYTQNSAPNPKDDASAVHHRLSHQR
jgi:hypothetical protein